MYTVYAEPPPELTQIRTGWAYAKDYFPHRCDTVTEARTIAKLAIKASAQHVQIVKDHPNPDSEPEIVPIAEPAYQNVWPAFCLDYVAGLCLRKFGIANGVTDEMIFWTQEGSGEQNIQVAEKSLIAAWHVVRAFLGKIDSPIPTETLSAWACVTEADWWEGAEKAVAERMQKLAEAEDVPF